MWRGHVEHFRFHLGTLHLAKWDTRMLSVKPHAVSRGCNRAQPILEGVCGATMVMALMLQGLAHMSSHCATFPSSRVWWRALKLVFLSRNDPPIIFLKKRPFINGVSKHNNMHPRARCENVNDVDITCHLDLWETLDDTPMISSRFLFVVTTPATVW